MARTVTAFPPNPGIYCLSFSKLAVKGVNSLWFKINWLEANCKGHQFNDRDQINRRFEGKLKTTAIASLVAPAMPTAWAPLIRAIWPTTEPTAPEAAATTTVSPTAHRQDKAATFLRIAGAVTLSESPRRRDHMPRRWPGKLVPLLRFYHHACIYLSLVVRLYVRALRGDSASVARSRYRSKSHSFSIVWTPVHSVFTRLFSRRNHLRLFYLRPKAT
jgi:hypothetical protein